MTRNRIAQFILLGIVIKMTVLGLMMTQSSSMMFYWLVGDVEHWQTFWRTLQEGQIPYVDFTREYPVGATLFYASLYPFFSTLTSVADKVSAVGLHGVIFSLIDIANFFLLFKVLNVFKVKRALIYAIAFFLLPTALVMSPFRFDNVVVMSILLGLWAHAEGRIVLRDIAWSLGCWLKWYPIVLIGTYGISQLVRKRDWKAFWKTSATFIVITILINGPFLAMSMSKYGNIDQWIATYTFHSKREAAFDSLWGFMWLWNEWMLSRNVLQNIMLISVVGTWILTWSWPSAIRCCLCLEVFLFTNRVYSPQFHLWIIPLVFLFMDGLSDSMRRKTWITLSVWEITNILVFPLTYTMMAQEFSTREFGTGRLWFSIFIIIRTLTFAALIWITWRAGQSLARKKWAPR